MTYWMVNGSVLAVLVVLCACTPYVVRKNDVFGDFFPDSASQLKKVRAMRLHYFVLCLFTGILCAGFWCMTVFFRLINGELAFPIFIVDYLLLQAAIYLYYHRRAKRMKQNREFSYTVEHHVAVDLSPQPRLVSFWWFVPHVLLIVVTAVVTFWREPVLDEQIPIHWDYAGNAVYTQKGFFSLFQLIFLQILMLLLFFGLLVLTSRSKKVIRSDNARESRRASILFKKLWCFYLVAMGFACLLWFSFLQFMILGLCPFSWMAPAIAIFMVLVGGGATVLIVYTGQGGSRLLRKGRETDRIDPREDDRYWKLGCIYFNPDDPSLMVEKRFGVGWTMNMARPAAWMILAGILLAVAVSIVVALISE